MNEKRIYALLWLVFGIKSRKNQASVQPFRCGFNFDEERNYAVCLLSSLSQMLKGFSIGKRCQPLSNSKDGKYVLHFPKAKLENGCWNKQIPDKYLQKENGEIIGYEKLAGVYKEKGRVRSMIEDRSLGGTLGINWNCSFQGQPVNGSMGNANALRLKGKDEKSRNQRKHPWTKKKLVPTFPTVP